MLWGEQVSANHLVAIQLRSPEGLYLRILSSIPPAYVQLKSPFLGSLKTAAGM